MEELIRQIRMASQIRLFYLALFGALALPDICGALASRRGSATPAHYKAWIKDNVPQQAAEADAIYGLRCSLLHQGRALPHGGHFPIAFMMPNGITLHNLSTQIADTGEKIGWISIPAFIDEMTLGAENWLRQYGDTELVANNMEKFARLRSDGLPPHIVGRPVIA